MAVNIGPRIGIDGEAEYRKELQQIIQSTKTLAAETNQAAAAFQNADDKEKAAADVTEKMNRQIEEQKKLIAKLEEGVQKAAEATGEESTQTLKWKEQLAKAKQGLAELEIKAKDATGDVKDLGNAEATAEKKTDSFGAEAKNAAAEVRDVGQEAETAGKKTSVFGDMLKANLASAAIQKGMKLTKDLAVKIGEALVEAVKSAAAYADEINTLSTKTGMSTKKIQEFRYASELLDVSFETVQGSLTKLKKNMDSARDGSKTATAAFEKLGINVKNADGTLRDANTVWYEAIDALGQIDNETERDAAAMELFGKSAADLNPLIEAGASRMRDLSREAENVGAVLDQETLDTLNEVQDGFDRLGMSWDALKKILGAKIGKAILPDLERIVRLFQELLQTGDVKKFTNSLSKDLSNALKKIEKKLPSIIDTVTDIGGDLGEKITKDIIPNLGKSILKALPKVMKSVGRGLEKLIPELGSMIGELLGSTLANVPAIIGAGVQLGKGLLKGLAGFPKALADGIAHGFKNPEVEEAVDTFYEDLEAKLQDVKDKLAEIPEANDRIAESFAEINAKQAESEYWVKVFEKLSKVIDPTAEQSERLKLAVEKLNELYPNLGIKIDEETGRWNTNADAIRANIAAYTEYALAQAYFDAAAETLVDKAKLELDRNKASKAWQEAQKATREYDEYTQRIQKAWEHRAGSVAQVLIDEGIDSEEAFKRFMEGRTEGWKKLNAAEKEAFKEWDAHKKKEKELQDDIDFLYTQGQLTMQEYYRLYTVAEEAQKQAQREAADDIGRYIRAKMAAIKKVISGEAKSIGELLDAGVKRGIDENADIVAGAAGNMIKAAIKRMQTVAQIKSPSRVTENLIGKNLGLGVVKGWDKVMNPEEIKKAFTLTPVFDALTGGDTTTNYSETVNMGGVTMNVYAREGMNVDELTDQVMIRMQRAVNARKAVFSSEFHI